MHTDKMGIWILFGEISKDDKTIRAQGAMFILCFHPCLSVFTCPS
jgi:hypothetical protein